MPNPKAGTVTVESAKAMAEIRKGRVEYKVEKAGIVHVSIGKVSFEAQRLYENAHSILESVMKARPASCKGRYLMSATLSRSEEHTSELQSLTNLVCRLLLEK